MNNWWKMIGIQAQQTDRKNTDIDSRNTDKRIYK